MDINVFIGTDDGIPFGMDIENAIRSGGWTIGAAPQTTGYGNLRGLSVALKDWSTPSPKAVIAAQALEQGGLAVNRVTDPRLRDDEVIIVISPKR